MKTKEVTCSFEYTAPEDLRLVLNYVFKQLTDGKEFHDRILFTPHGKKYIHFKQSYKKLRSFKIVNTDSVIVKSNV